ncbi:MAG: response regulator [Proteobacteria bacterium]|nr:response regulator [Pseudomonadota bacterium]
MTGFVKNDLLRLAQIVKEETGNNVQEKNFSMLESRLKARMLKLGIGDIQDYWIHFSKNEQLERQQWQSLMTTHYTFFFRESVHFEQLEKWIDANVEKIKSRYSDKKSPLKVWSAACSRGQEVYSLAMFLEFALFKKYGIPFEVLGTDIDAESVQYAKNGVYPIQEVNTIPQKYLNGYWKKGTGDIKDFAAVHPNLRAKTKFQTVNLLEGHTYPQNEKFDVIFVRNVFIYFTEEHVRQIALSLRSRLSEGGLFVSGLSEPLRFEGWDMESIAPSTYTTKGATATNQPAASKASESMPMSAISTLKAPAAVSSQYRVLCVDDSSTIQVVMKKIYSQDKDCIEVVSAMNGEEARKKLDAGKFDVMTLDIHMPVMGGIEFLESAYKKDTDPPVLMISSVNRTDADLATKALSLGAFDYIEKPAMNNLQKSIDEILSKTKMALKARGSKEDPIVNASTQSKDDFNKSISQKIVVPDASQCIRWIKVQQHAVSVLEPVIKALKGELRSPPLVIAVPKPFMTSIQSLVAGLSSHKVELFNDPKGFLKPNTIYVCDEALEPSLVVGLKVKNFSLQILSKPNSELDCFRAFSNIQVLVDESVGSAADSYLSRAKLVMSDMCPSTSFVSLSLEYFANLRKPTAA